ncbi:MAG TPA: SRPBCC domain-containing protein [Gemmatimonadales bacterium]|nr:SRPBCC domain-containing protein [Gemmatimonadales bacterium]
MSKQRDERVVEREVALDAPTAVVWKALTDAGELMRWFRLEARVSPGMGGTVWMRWDDAYDAESAIEIWEPERHLRIRFPRERAMHLATDYYLEGRAAGRCCAW